MPTHLRTRRSGPAGVALALALAPAAALAGDDDGLHGLVRGGLASAGAGQRESGLALGGGVEYRIGPLGVGGLYDFVAFDLPNGDRLRLHALTPAIQFHFAAGSRFQPYLHVGATLFHEDLQTTASDLTAIGFTTDFEAQAKTALSAGAGVRIATGARGAIDLNGRFLRSDLETRASIADVVTGLSATARAESSGLDLYLVTLGYSIRF